MDRSIAFTATVAIQSSGSAFRGRSCPGRHDVAAQSDRGSPGLSQERQSGDPAVAPRVGRSPSRRPTGAPTMVWNPFSWFLPEPDFDIAERQRQGVPAIRVQNLSKSFRTKRMRGTKRELGNMVHAVQGISFEVRPGEIFGLLGPNSCGKTTTMRCMSTLSKQDEGVVEIYGVNTLKDRTRARQLMSFVSQSDGLDKILSGREHLELFANLAHLDKKERAENIQQLIQVLDLGEFIDRPTKNYSGGIIRRLDMAIALLKRPAVLILDEPTVGLDPETREVIWSLLQELRDNGAAIMLTSHYLEEVDVLADSIAIMDNGVIIAQGTTSELKRALGGDRISINIDEFTSVETAEGIADVLLKQGVASSAIVNRVRGNSIELVVPSNDPQIGSAVLDLLRALGHDRLFRFSQSQPSLDDVYLTATGKNLADADQEGRKTRDTKTLRRESMK